MRLALPIITLGLAALGGSWVGNLQPKPLAAQSALCSFGSSTQCREIHTCTKRSWTIGLKAWSFALGPCVSWYVDTLYYKLGAGTGSPGGQDQPADPGDDNQGNGDGETG